MSLPQPDKGCKPPQVLIYPKIAAQAIKSGHAEAYRLYVLVQARSTACQGRYIFTRAEIRAFCTGLLNDQQIDRALAAGNGMFWSYSPQHQTYRMVSRAKVALALGFSGNPGRTVLVPASAFQGRLAGWKAAVYAAYLSQMRKATPSRDHLQEVFGVSLPTLLDWERRAGIKVRPRLVMAVTLGEMVGPGHDQAVAEATSGEIERSRTARTWLTVVGPRGGIIAGRRLMDNENNPLPDYWEVQDEPGWEGNSTIRFTWQTTNVYQSPLNVAPSGRGSWLAADIKRRSIPDTDAMGSTERRPAPDYDHRPGWHDIPATAVKWQRRKWNRGRPAIVAQYRKHLIVGEWWPSHAVLWGERA